MRGENLRPKNISNNNEQPSFVSAIVLILILIGGFCAIKELTDPKIITSTNSEVQDGNNLGKADNPNDSIFADPQKKD